MTLHKTVMAVFLCARYDITAWVRSDNFRLLFLETFQLRHFHDRKDSADFPQLQRDLFQGGARNYVLWTLKVHFIASYGCYFLLSHLPKLMDLLEPRLKFLILVGTGGHTEFIYHTLSLTTRFNTVNCFVFLKFLLQVTKLVFPWNQIDCLTTT